MLLGEGWGVRRSPLWRYESDTRMVKWAINWCPHTPSTFTSSLPSIQFCASRASSDQKSSYQGCYPDPW